MYILIIIFFDMPPPPRLSRLLINSWILRGIIKVDNELTGDNGGLTVTGIGKATDNS